MSCFKKTLVSLAFTSLLASPCIAQSSQQSPSWDLPWHYLIYPSVTSADIYRAFVEGHYQYTLQLIARRVANDPALQKRLVAAGATYLQKIVDDPNLSQEEKMTEVMKKMEGSFGAWVSQREGALGLSYKHSIAFGVNRLEWDDREVTQTCDRIASYKYVCNLGVCGNQVSYTEEKAVISPDFKVYRNEGGQETLLTTIKGGLSLSTKSYDFSSPTKALTSSMNLAYQKYYKGDNSNYSRPVFDDYISVNRIGGGRALSYRVVADYNPYSYKSCHSSEVVESASAFDVDGDLRPDFIPAIVYETPPSITEAPAEYLSGSNVLLNVNIVGGVPPFTLNAETRVCYVNGVVDPNCFYNANFVVDNDRHRVGVWLQDPCVPLTQAQFNVTITDASNRVSPVQILTAHLDPQNFFPGRDQCQPY